MKSYAVLTASGSDRIGIVNEFTTRLLEFSCNIEESKMAVLGGEFAMIVLVSGDEIPRLLESIGKTDFVPGLEISGKPTGPHVMRQQGRPYRIESISLDTPGIVRSVTALLHRKGVGIDELETETSGAPFTGAPMFHASMTVIIPSDISVSGLRKDLNEIGEEHDLDIRMVPIVPLAEE